MNGVLPHRRILAALAAAALALPAHADDALRERARQLYEDCHWQQAFEAYARLAEAGDVEAARIASLMARHGVMLYGTRFPASADQVERWLLASSKVARP